jgi:hypothetical protein
MISNQHRRRSFVVVRSRRLGLAYTKSEIIIDFSLRGDRFAQCFQWNQLISALEVIKKETFVNCHRGPANMGTAAASV